jgi:hypothetical protein
MALTGAYSRAGRHQDARRERRLSMDMAAGVRQPELSVQNAEGGNRSPENQW